MSLTRHLYESLQNLWLFKLRSALALLGMLVGAAAVVALISSGQLATQQALDQFKSLGTELFAIMIDPPAETRPGQEENLQLAQVKQIQAASSSILVTAPYTLDYSKIYYNGHAMPGTIVGATQALAQIINIQIGKGRFVSELDQRQFFCVVGSDIAGQMQRSGALNPVGQQIRVGGNYFTVVGVAGPWLENMFMNAEINHAVIVPIESSFSLSKYARIQNILFKLQPGSDVDQIQQKISTVVHQLLPNAKLFSHSAKQLIDSMQKQRQTFTLMLGAIGGIALVVGGIGVMNIMLVSVIERRREIGIRMAIGAKQRDIRAMFLVEAVVLATLGGILGIMLGVAASYVIALFSHWPFTLYILPVIIGFSVSALVGVVSGYYPAYKASQLDPIETLRAE